MAEGWGSRLLQATTTVSIPAFTSQHNETGIGIQCGQATANSTGSFLNSTWYLINCNPTYTVDSQIWLTMITSAAVGIVCLAVFCWGQSFVSVYRGRLLSPHVALKPPVGNSRSFYSKYLSWLWVTMTLSEKELLATAGMDALMFERLIVFSLQFMAPVTVVAMSTLIPIHMASDFSSVHSQQFAQANLITLTMANLPDSARILWVHFVLVVLFTCYGMWLLDQHYKSYVLLRQQYLTHGDSVSAWLGRTPKQRPLASHGSMLAHGLPAGEDLSQPMWTFARARVTAERVGSGGHRPITAAAGRGVSARDNKPPAAATAQDDGTAEQQGMGLSELTSMQPHDTPRRQSPQPMHPLQELQAHALTDLDQQPPQQAAPAVLSPFALQQDEDLLGHTTTLQMVQLTDVFFSVDSEGSKSIAAQPSMDALPQLAPQSPAAAPASCADGDATTLSPSELSSAAGSTLLSRQSSTHALLTSRHADSCTTDAPHRQGSQRRGFSFMQPVRSRHPEQRQQLQTSLEGSADGHGEGLDLDSAAGAVPHSTVAELARKRFNGCGSCRWRRLSSGMSDSDTAGAAVSFAPDVDTPSPRAVARKAEAAAAAAAAKQLGADVDWWEFKTGDVLLDRHIVKLDVDKDLQGEQSKRPFFWWRLVPSDACSTSGSSGGAASSNILPVPGTRLLFDRRSLRTRRPSVRFRNTVHVRSHDGSLVPLHVSNYAVLVTDVPDPGRAQRSSSACEEDFSPGSMCWQPWEKFLGSILRLVEVVLEFLMWAWPCLLSREDLLQYARDWGQTSLKSTQSMLIAKDNELAELEAGNLLVGSMQDNQQPPPPRRVQSQWQRQAVFQSRAFDRPCFDRRRLVELTFRHLFPGDVQAVIPAQEYTAVNELLREWNREMQAFIFTAALLKLKEERQQRKEQRELRKAATKAAAEATATAGQGQQQQRQQQQQQGASNGVQEVCIEVANIQDKLAAKTAAAADEQAINTADSGQLACGVAGPACAAAHAGSRLNSSSSSIAAGGTGTPGDGCPPAGPHPDMVRPVSVDSFDDDSSESDDEQGCCSSMARRLCCCPCCFMGAIQDVDGRNMLSQEEPAAGSWCCRVFRRRARRVDMAEQINSDVLEERREKILKLEEQILEAQKEVLASPDTGNFIVLFKSPRSASLAANSTVYPHEGSVEAFKVQPAPNPEDVLWPSLWASPADRRAVLCKCVFWFAILFAVPTGFFAAAMNGITLSMCSSSTYHRFKWLCDSRFLKFLLTVVVPFILLMVWQNAVIPAQLYRLELRRAVAVSLSQMERRILLTYCSWELINLFLGGVLSGSLLTQVQKFIEHPETWAQILGGAIPQTSNFFLLYVIQRAFMMNFVRLLMPHGGMWRWLGQMLFTGFTSFRHAATAAYRARIIYPASIRYGREPGLVLLILLIGVAYCVAAPLITIFVLAYMFTAYIVWRYQIIYVSTRAYESGGRTWPTFFLCIIYCLGFFVAFTSSMLIFKKGNLQGMLVLLLLPLLYIFNRRCRVRYFAKVDHPPLWLAHTAPCSEIDPLVYTPPCLQPNAQGWFFEAGKPWLRWGVPSYNNPKGRGHDAGGLFC